MDFGQADVSLGCDFTRGTDGSDHGGLCFRYSNTTNYLYVRVTGTAIEVRKVDAGSDSQVATAGHTWNSGASKFLQVVLHGSSIRVFVANSLSVDTSSSFNSSATSHGLFCDDEADHSWDGFGGWVSLFYGPIDSIHPRPGLGEQYCYVRALDDMERLTSVQLYMYATSSLPQGSDEILGDILDYAGVGANPRLLDAGTNLVPDTFSPAIWGVLATDEIHRLQDEEDGFIYVDGQGYWRLENRTHRTSAPHTTSQATIKDTDDGTNSYFSELVWDDGVDNVENMVYMRVRGYTNNGSQTAWTLSEKPQFASSETKEFLAESVNHDTVGGQVAPVENTDYDANTQQGGGGTDISSELTVTHANTTDYNGKGTLIRVVFGATAGYLTLLQLRTLNAIDFDDPVLLLQEDSTSKTAYGERAKTIEARWTREVDVALATIASRLARKKDPKTVINVTVPNGSKANLMLMLQRGLSDRVTVSYSDMGISEDFLWRGVRLRSPRGGPRLPASCCFGGCNHVDIDLTPFLNAGIPGLLLAWFMFRLERILSRFDKAVQLMARATIRLLERADPEEASSLSKALYRDDR